MWELQLPEHVLIYPEHRITLYLLLIREAPGLSQFEFTNVASLKFNIYIKHNII